MARQDRILQSIDWPTVLIYIACVIMGWLNVYAAVYNPEAQTSLFDINTESGKQLLFIGLSVLIIIMILVIDFRFYEAFSFPIYGFALVLLVAVIFLGANIKGSHSWFKIGSFGFQPAEFSKMATVLALAKYIGTTGINLTRFKDQANVIIIIAIPAILIRLSNETGVALVFASMLMLLYREGLPGIYPAIFLTLIALFVFALALPKIYTIIGLAVLAGLILLVMPRYERVRKNYILIGGLYVGMAAMVFTVDFVFNNLLEAHQRSRITILFNPEADRKGDGWNVIQSKIAIGSGGFFGKGFLEGTQTKFDFVPAQHTDFIFCTIGEEHGFLGTTVVLGLLLALIFRIMYLADQQKNRFSRVYGYGVASIFFFHLLVNVGMTIGFMPVIGIPLPFFSYGGSSLWTFTMLLFVFLKLDAHRSQMLSRF
jgi:rod shape determining protein RodA